MKKILLIGILSIFVISCSTEENAEVIGSSADLTTLVNTNVYGKYTGIFTTLDSEQRGIINVTIPATDQNYFAKHTIPTATLILENGSKVRVYSSEEVVSGQAISGMLFKNDVLSFLYSVDANGANSSITNLVYNGAEGAVRLAKNLIGKAAVNPITGTFSCSDCKGHPALTDNQEYTFNIMFPTGDDGNKSDIVSQILIPGLPNSPFGTSDNIQGAVSTGTTRMQSTVNGIDINGALNWSSTYYKSNSGNCNAAFGTWSLVSDVVGDTIEGVFVTDNADACKETFINEDFNSFTGAGFSPGFVAGRINSDFIAVTGFSDGDLAFGGTQLSNDYTRGTANSGVGPGGIYAGIVGPGDNCLLVQSSGADFTPGTITVRAQNLSGLDFSNVQVMADLLIRNDQPSSTSISLAYSIDNITFTPIPGVASINTPAASTGSDLILATSLDRLIPLNISNNNFIYFRITANDVSVSGRRDEIGIDNIKVLGF